VPPPESSQWLPNKFTEELALLPVLGWRYARFCDCGLGDCGQIGSMSSSLINREYYDRFWERARVWLPTAWLEWDVVRGLLPSDGRVLEIGAGKRPRVPIALSFFADLSWKAEHALAQFGANASVADARCLPFANYSFDLVVAVEILEHIEDDQGSLVEWSRVLKPGGQLVLTVPLHDHLWTAFDHIVGHVRRYELADLQAKLERARFRIERYVADQIPLYRRMKQLEAIVLTIAPQAAMWLEDRIVMPLSTKLSRRIRKFDWRVQLDQEADLAAAIALVVCKRLIV